jgi:hypothetical protein
VDDIRERIMQTMKVYKRILRPWNPTKAGIERQLKRKELEFAHKDNRNPKITSHKYLEKYVFSDLHEVFFCDLPCLLQEWLLRLKENHPTNRIRQLEWNSSGDRIVTTS